MEFVRKLRKLKHLKSEMFQTCANLKILNLSARSWHKLKIPNPLAQK